MRAPASSGLPLGVKRSFALIFPFSVPFENCEQGEQAGLNPDTCADSSALRHLNDAGQELRFVVTSSRTLAKEKHE